MRKDMTWKQRIEYFRDYYLFKTVCAVAAIAVFLLLIWHFFIRDNEVSLYVAVVNDSLEIEAADRLKENLGEALGIDADKIMIDDEFYLEGDGLNKLEIYLKNSQIDVLIAAQEDYEWLCGFGFMKDIQKIFDESVIAAYEKQVVSAAGYLDSDEISFEDHETGQGEVLGYGFCVTETSNYGTICKVRHNPVIGIAESTTRGELAVQCVTWLLGE